MLILGSALLFLPLFHISGSMAASGEEEISYSVKETCPIVHQLHSQFNRQSFMNSTTSFLLQRSSDSVSYIMLSNIDMKFLILLAIFDPWLVHSNTEDANA